MADFDWLVVMGGPMNVYEELQYPWLAAEKAFIGRAIESNKMVLGICLGAQLIADVLGAGISANRQKEIGWFPVYRTALADRLPQVAALEDAVECLHWHADRFELPPGAVHVARSDACDNQAFVYGQRVLGLQFHLEVTPEGLQALVQNCKNEITDGPFVQSAESMLANPQRFQRASRTMNRLLDTMAGLAGPDPKGPAETGRQFQSD